MWKNIFRRLEHFYKVVNLVSVDRKSFTWVRADSYILLVIAECKVADLCFCLTIFFPNFNDETSD